MSSKLENDISELKELLAKFDTLPLMMHIANTFTSTNIFSTGLTSPYKQSLYLGGLLLSTDQKDNLELTEETIKTINEKLQDIVMDYSLTFFPTEEEYLEGLTDDWKRFREVSMPMFLDYFNTVSLTYQEQQIDRIKRWFLPLNEIIKESEGISVEELLEMFHFIFHYLETNIKNEEEQIQDAKKKLDGLLKKAYSEKMTLETIQETAKENGTQNAWRELFDSFGSVYQISIHDLEKKFGTDSVKVFINNFTLKRESRDFQYYTEPNPFERSPIWLLDDKSIFIPCVKQILNSIYDYLYRVSEKPALKDRFYKNRDKQVESQALDIFKKLFKDDAIYHTSVFENDKSQNEHDIVVLYKSIVLIVEVKASKLKEPFRDPQKAYERILRDFRSDRGIQKAYDQGQNLKKLILENPITTLYDDKGKKIVDINRESISDIFIICLTAEHYGMLGINLSLLLEKKIEEPFPWSCNIYDLENIIDAFNYKKMPPEKFIEYLKGRSEIHSKIHSFDELEICGYFITNNGFDTLKKTDKDLIYFTPDLSDVFDEIYFQKSGLEHPLFNPKKENPKTKKENLSKGQKRNKKFEKQRKRDRKNNRKKK